ncbi:protein kinase, partial [Streptomyces calidiresistens]
MDGFPGRVLADRYQLPRLPTDEFELVESRAFDTASGQEVLVRQVPLPEVVDAETLDGTRPGGPGGSGGYPRATRTPDDPVVRRAVEAAAAAAGLPDHARLDQVFDVFVQGDGLWIVSELVPARPLAALLAEAPLNPYRAAEVAADLLAALRVVHAHGWVHRNLTARTVLICDDGRALLTGLASGAAEEVLCGYDPFPAAGPAAEHREPPGAGGEGGRGPRDTAPRPVEQSGPPREMPGGPGPSHGPGHNRIDPVDRGPETMRLRTTGPAGGPPYDPAAAPPGAASPP